MTTCSICGKKIVNGQSFSCSVIGIDSEGKYEVIKLHLGCRCSEKYERIKKGRNNIIVK